MKSKERDNAAAIILGLSMIDGVMAMPWQKVNVPSGNAENGAQDLELAWRRMISDNRPWNLVLALDLDRRPWTWS